MKKNLLVALADEHFLDQAKQLFSSVYWNAGWKGDYMLLACDIPEEKLKWFREKGILIKKCSPLLNKIFERNESIMLCKFYLFKPEFKRWEHIIYLDADIIVKGSLDRLTNMSGFAAVKDSIHPFRRQFDSVLTNNHKMLLINLEQKYDLNLDNFNAGMFVVDTSIITSDIFNELIFLADSYGMLSTKGDQPILNLYFYNRWQKLPLCYNIYPYNLAHPFLIRDVKSIIGIIFHFIGKRKPWDKRDPFYGEWKHNLEIAESIDINKPISVKILDKKEIIKISRRIKIKMVLYSPIRILDRLIGLFGLILKRRFQKTSEIDKKLESRR